MKKSMSLFVYGSILILLIPYLCVSFLNGTELAFAGRQIDVEKVLPAILAAEIPQKYEQETMKAQAVIARSNLYRCIEDGKAMQNIREKLPQNRNEISRFVKISKQCEQAVLETKGLVLLWEEKLVPVPYHQISAGKTRNGEEVFHSDEYKYLVSVNSDVDKSAEKYLCGRYVLKRQMPKELEIAERDSVGYVTELRADGKTIEGEAFRDGLALPSASFTIQTIGEKMRFLCRGRGHGLGFSQYGGNEMAREGSTYIEILAHYFPKMQIKNIEEL